MGDRTMVCSGVRRVEWYFRKLSFHGDMMGLDAWVRSGVGCSMRSIGARATWDCMRSFSARTALDATVVAGCLGIGRVHGDSCDVGSQNKRKSSWVRNSTCR